MKYFVTTILNKGKKEQIGMYAEDRKEVNELVKLKHSGIILKISQEREPLEAQFKRFKTTFLSNIKKRKIEQDSLIASIRQLAVMTNAGISIYDSLNEISKSTTDKTLKLVFKKLSEDINSGHSLSKPMNNFRYELGNLCIAMVQLGEKTGKIDDALFSLANMLEDVRANIIKFKKAMSYPKNVMIAMAVAFSILISYVVPNFKNMFEKLNTQLPIPTKILLKLEYLFNNYGLYILIFLSISSVIFKYLINNNYNIRYGWHKVLLKIYFIKNVIMFATLSRFTLILSELIRAGIPITQALETSVSMVENLPLKNKLASVRFAVEKGSSLHVGLEDTKLFENIIIQMISAAEDSGTLDTMTGKVAEYYKMRFDAVINGLSESIEPVMLFFIASMVLLLALGIFLPMWDIGNVVMGR